MKDSDSSLSPERWSKLSLAMQLVNIDTELARAQSMRAKGDEGHAQKSFARALDLADLTVAVQPQPHRRRELARLREILTDVVSGSNTYQVKLEDIRQLLAPFMILVARERGV